MWVFRRTTREPPDRREHMARSEEADQAIEQARRADVDADKSLSEMRRVVDRIRAQREQNHFSAAIWDSMRRK